MFQYLTWQYTAIKCTTSGVRRSWVSISKVTTPKLSGWRQGTLTFLTSLLVDWWLLSSGWGLVRLGCSLPARLFRAPVVSGTSFVIGCLGWPRVGGSAHASLTLQQAGLGLLIWRSQGSARRNRSLQGLLRLRLGTGALPLLFYLVDRHKAIQRNRELEPASWLEERQGYTAKDMALGRIVAIFAENLPYMLIRYRTLGN